MRNINIDAGGTAVNCDKKKASTANQKILEHKTITHLHSNITYI